jgi:uncharacterized protein YndB with AHSA1/START domain
MHDITDHTVTHASFTIERQYGATPARVFAAFADKEQKGEWFAAPGDTGPVTWEFDFRDGGREYNSGAWEGGPTHSFDAHYLDIVENERIIYSYVMHVDGRKLSASLATLEFAAVEGGTLLTITEAGAFLDGLDSAVSREQGTRDLLDALGASLEG